MGGSKRVGDNAAGARPRPIAAPNSYGRRFRGSRLLSPVVNGARDGRSCVTGGTWSATLALVGVQAVWATPQIGQRLGERQSTNERHDASSPCSYSTAVNVTLPNDSGIVTNSARYSPP